MSSFPLPPSAFPLIPRIAVIGGGISGLAAAHRLVELLPQAKLSLFEASDRLGGVLDTVDRQGFLVERSADNFLVTPPAGVELCKQLGIEDSLLSTDESRRRAFVVRDGQLVPIPDGFYLMSPRKLLPLLASPMLSLKGKLRLLAEPFISRRPVAGLDTQISPFNSQPDESVAAFARRRLGREVFERLVQPLVAGIYTADPEKLSMAATMPQFLEFERASGSLLRATLLHQRPNDPSNLRRDRVSNPANEVDTKASTSASGARYGLFVAPQNGMRSLVTAIADHLPRDTIHLNTRVTSIRRQADRLWSLTFDNPNSALPAPHTSFDALVLALPSFVAARLLEQCDSALATELSSIEYAGCAVVSLGFTRAQVGHPLDGFGFVVPQIERRRIIAASFASLKFPGRAPDDAVLIRVFIGGALQPELLQLPDDELRQLACEELRSILSINGEPVLTDIARWPRSMPQYHVGHLARIARIEELVGRHASLALAGNAYRGVGIPQCIASGQAAAERIASKRV